LTVADRPQNVALSATSESAINVSWTAPANDGGSAVDSYTVRYRVEGGLESDWVSANTSALSTDISGLTAGTRYQVQVSANNGVGQSKWSLSAAETSLSAGAPIVASAAALAAADAVVLASSAATAHTVTLNWVTPADNGSAITGYALQFKAPGDVAWTLANQVIAAADTSVTYDAGLDKATKALQSYVNIQKILNPAFTISDAAAAAFKAALVSSFNIAGYSFRIAALNDAAPTAGLANFSSTVVADVVPATAIDIATDNVVGNLGTGFTSTVTLTWTSPATSPVTGWSVQYRATGDDAWTAVPGTVTGTTVDIATLLVDTEYEFQIAGVDRFGTGAYGDSTFLVTSPIPTAAPDAVVFDTFSAAPHTVTLNWTAPANNNAVISGYALQYKGPADLDWSLANQSIAADATSVTYDVASDVAAQAFQAYVNAQLLLDPNFSISVPDAAAWVASYVGAFSIDGYSFRLGALNSAAPSVDLANFSDALLVNYVPATVFDTATDVVAGDLTAGFLSTVTLNWTEPMVNDLFPLTGWTVQYRATGDDAWTTVTGPIIDPTVDVAGLLPDTEYEFRLAGLNSVGTGAYGDSTFLVTDVIPTAAPDAVVFDTFSAAPHTVTLNWTAPANNNAVISGYALQYKGPADLDWSLANQSIAADATSVTYDIAADLADQSLQNYVNSQLALDPTFVISPDLYNAIKTLYLSSFNMAGYSFRLAAVNSAAPSIDLANFSDAVVVDVVPATVIDGATDVVDGSYVGGYFSTVTLNWTDPANSNTVPTTGWSVRYRKTGSNGWTTVTGPITASTVDVAGLLPGTEYEFQLAGTNQIGDSAFGNSFYYTTDLAPTFSAPAAPDFADSSSTATSITVSWGESADDGGLAVTGYSLGYRATSASSWTYVTLGNVWSYQLTGLASSTHYELKVAAINLVGTGSYSAIGDVATKAVAVAPTTVLFNLNSAVLSAKAVASIKAWVKTFSKSRVVHVNGFANGITNKLATADAAAKSIAAARTAAVVKLLKSLNVKVKAYSHGSNWPIDKKNGAKNRRVVLSVM
jgi:titin